MSVRLNYTVPIRQVQVLLAECREERSKRRRSFLFNFNMYNNFKMFDPFSLFNKFKKPALSQIQ